MLCVSAVFSLFLLFQTNFCLKSRKNILKCLKKLCFKLDFIAGRLPEGVPPIWLFLVWFQVWNHWKSFKMNRKGWKRLKKVVRSAFWWHLILLLECSWILWLCKTLIILSLFFSRLIFRSWVNFIQKSNPNWRGEVITMLQLVYIIFLW